MTDDEIIRARLLVDERPLKRLIKKFYSIASCSSEDIDSSYAQFVLELDSQDNVASLKAKTGSVAHDEISTYEKQMQRIQEETIESERLILELKQELAAAQQSRRNKIIYDAIAKEALKLPSRSTSAETIQRLTAELKDLEAEQAKYAITWSSRQEAFSAVVNSLEELGEKVKEEKSEQELKDALRDGDDDMDGGESTTAATAGSKGGDESSNEDTDSGLQVQSTKKNAAALDPTAPTFEPSPLRQEQNATQEEDGEEGDMAEQMEVDEEAIAQKNSNKKSRSRTTSTREGEEEESLKDETTTS